MKRRMIVLGGGALLDVAGAAWHASGRRGSLAGGVLQASHTIGVTGSG